MDCLWILLIFHFIVTVTLLNSVSSTISSSTVISSVLPTQTQSEQFTISSSQQATVTPSQQVTVTPSQQATVTPSHQSSVTPYQTTTKPQPVTNWADRLWVEIHPLPGIIAMICAACLIIILIIALCCVCSKYRKLKKFSKQKTPYVNGHTDWIRGNDNVMMYERSLRASEVVPHNSIDYAAVNGELPPSYPSAQF